MVTISGMEIGSNSKSFLIAEVGQAHEGSLGMAHAYIDAIARTGVDAVKFQTHIASEESTPRDDWRVKFSYEDDTRLDYWKRMEFTEEQWSGLADHARNKGLVFLSSPFSVAAVELLERIGTPAWKVASGEISNTPLLDAIRQTRKPVLLSTGMSSMSEIQDAVNYLRTGDCACDVALFQCYTAYPCPPEKVGVQLIQDMADRFGCVVGLSDHSGTIFPSISAVTIGAKLIEVHVVMSRDMFGPDVTASVTVDELKTLVEGVRFVERMMSSPVEKDIEAEQLAPLRKLFFKSVVAAERVRAGTILTTENLTVKKPGNGVSAARFQEFLGRRVTVDLEKDQQLFFEQTEEVVK